VQPSVALSCPLLQEAGFNVAALLFEGLGFLVLVIASNWDQLKVKADSGSKHA